MTPHSFRAYKSAIRIFGLAPFFVALMAVMLTVSSPVSAGTEAPETRLREFNLEKGVAIQGYDPVAYFTRNQAVKGDPEISHTHKGVTYYFASAGHRSKFQETPKKFEPAYGGWCAYAMGENGSKVRIDPETFKITDGRLYLFYNFYLINTKTKWEQDQERLKERADQLWKLHLSGQEIPE